MSQLRTSPPSTEIGSHETFSLGVDFARYLQAGEAVNDGGAPVAFLYDDTDGGTDVSATNLQGLPTVSGTVVIPVITALTPNHNYRLVTIIYPGTVDGRQATTLVICPE